MGNTTLDSLNEFEKNRKEQKEKTEQFNKESAEKKKLFDNAYNTKKDTVIIPKMNEIIKGFTAKGHQCKLLTQQEILKTNNPLMHRNPSMYLFNINQHYAFNIVFVGNSDTEKVTTEINFAVPQHKSIISQSSLEEITEKLVDDKVNEAFLKAIGK